MSGTDTPRRGRSARDVLEQRARELARPLEPERERGREVLAFTVGEQRYALPVATVREIVPGGPLARLPGSPPSLLGLMNVRGTLLGVFDLRADAAERQPAWVVVLDDDPVPVGLAADTIDGISTVDPGGLVELPDATADTADDHLAGLTAGGVAVLDADGLLAGDHFAPFADPTAPRRTDG